MLYESTGEEPRNKKHAGKQGLTPPKRGSYPRNYLDRVQSGGLEWGGGGSLLEGVRKEGLQVATRLRTWTVRAHLMNGVMDMVARYAS